MKFKRFEDIPVWQAGAQLSAEIFVMTDDPSFRGRGDIASQLNRAGLSVPNNISEGFERGTTQELITFLYYAKGSAGEVRSILRVMDLLPFFDHLSKEKNDLKLRAESVSRQLGAWAESLQNSEIRGQRYLTEQSRQSYDQKQRADAFIQHLKVYTDKSKSQISNSGSQIPDSKSEISNLKSEIDGGSKP